VRRIPEIENLKVRVDIATLQKKNTNKDKEYREENKVKEHRANEVP